MFTKHKTSKVSSMIRIFPALLLTMLLVACVETDDEIPVIDMNSENAFPQNCVTVYRGESFTFHARFTDNIELGSYSIELHNNFDHHTHSTSVVTCAFDPVKTAVNPFLYIKEFSIPDNLTEYLATVSIDIPGDVDTGDYHFMIRLTDKSGWQSFKGISIKIAEKGLL